MGSLQEMLNKVIQGDCLEVMKNIPDNSIDTIITDPPYGLEFMGKDWDKFREGENIAGGNTGLNTPYGRKRALPSFYQLDEEKKNNYQLFNFNWAKECLRVAKPGAFLLCFGGTRTWHRLACGIEDAGWEMKDTLMWLYGSGFPKSLNIGKAIDKRGGQSVAWFGKWLRKWRKNNGITQKEIAKLFPSKTGGLTGCVANWELGLNMPTNEQFNLICKTFNLPFRSLEEVKREVARQKVTNKTVYRNIGRQNIGGIIDITKGFSVWEGYGTALKPAYEPIIMAMKPLDGTYVENALQWGVAGLNIDGGRIETNEDLSIERKERKLDTQNQGWGFKAVSRDNKGRFPANVILDEESAQILDEQTRNGVSRFFYVAKASRDERNIGCKGFINTHPTVKPIKLMEYLCKLTKTPYGGIVLDPFGGSGTTALACIKTGRPFVLIEREEEYCKIANARIQAMIRKNNLLFKEEDLNE